MLFWTNFFNHQKTYTRPLEQQNKPICYRPETSFSLPKPIWNEAYQAYLTQLIKALQDQIATQQQLKKLLQVSYHLEKALNHA